MERLVERRQFEESWGQEYIMETGGKMDCTDNYGKIILYRLWYLWYIVFDIIDKFFKKFSSSISFDF